MWSLVAATGMVVVVVLAGFTWARSRRVNDTRQSPAQEEAEAAAHSRPLANVTVLRRGDAGDGREGG